MMTTNWSEDKGIFWTRYRDSLVAFGHNIRSKEPTYIIAMTRKAPRLLELCDLWGVDYGNAQVLTEKSLDFVDNSELKGKGLVIIDDIIILGSTIHRLLKKYPNLEKAAILCLVSDVTWFTKELVPNAEPQMKLGQHEASIFCNELVQSIGYLNKPYDLDHPIIYGRLSAEDLVYLCSKESPDTAYEISSSFHRAIYKRRFSFLPNELVIDDLISTVFRNSEAVLPQICKCRLYYDEETACANLVPMLIYDAKISNIRNGELSFSSWLDPYNQLIRQVMQEKSRATDMTRFRLFSYLSSYLAGITFCIRSSNGNVALNSSSLPSTFLKARDLCYLFGPRASEQILRALDELYPSTLVTFQKAKSRPFQLGLYVTPPAKPVDTVSQEIFDSRARKLLERITPYLQKNLAKSSFIEDQLACVFEGMFYTSEMPARKRIKKRKNLRGEPYRLARGFTYEQIRHILTDFGVLDSGDPNANTRLSLALDWLVDCGVIVPFYVQTNGSLRRFYRYGEDSLCQRKMGFLFATVLRDVFGQEQQRTHRSTIPKIPLEKTLVLLVRKLQGLPHDVAVLQPGAGMSRTVNLKLGYCIHGAILETEYLDERGLPKTEWASDWCMNQGILSEGKGKHGFTYSNRFFRQHPEELSMVSEAVSSKYLMLAQVLRYVDSTVDQSSKNDYLVCLSTCHNAESTMAAMTREIFYLFKTSERESSNFSEGVGYSLEWLFENPFLRDLVGYLEKGKKDVAGLLTKCETRVTNADQAANESLSKYKLYNNRLSIVNSIKSHFQGTQFNGEYKVYYQNQLLELLDEIADDANRAQDPGIDESLRKVAEVGSLCIQVCAILKVLLSITSSLTSGYMTKAGQLHKGTVRKVKREIDQVQQFVQRLNESIDKSNTTFPGRTIRELPQISLSSTGNGEVPDIISWAGVLKHTVSQLAGVWSSLKCIYAENYAPEPLRKEMEILFPKDTLISPFRWVIWYDIKDSQGRRNPSNLEKTPRLKKKINMDLETATGNLKDGKFTPDRNDEKFINAVKPESIPVLLQTVLDAADEVGMFLRVGIAGVDDTGVPFLKISGTDFLESETTFALPKRLGACLNSDDSVRNLQAYTPEAKDIEKETDNAHTLVVSNEVYRQVWNRKLPTGSPVKIGYPVDGKKEYIFYILRSVPRGSKFPSQNFM